MRPEIRAEVGVAADIFDEITEASDSLNVEEGIDIYEALLEARAKLNLALSMVDTQLKLTLESPRQVGSRIFYRKPDGKWRPDHDELKRRIVTAAAMNDHGELRSVMEAAREAVELMYDLFVAPAKMPTTKGLDRLHLDKTDVARWERTGFRVVVDEGGEPE